MARPIRWGILSTARIGREIIRGIGLSDGSCVQAVASRDETRAGEWAKEHGIPKAFGSYEDLLESGEVDCIYNPLPNSLHAEWTIKALEAGFPVLCEKPFTVNADEARTVIAAAQRTQQLVAEAFMYRFHPMWDTIIDYIAGGAIGDVVSIRSTFAFRLKDRNNIRASGELAGGSLMDVGCYCVNLSRRIADCEPVRAHAFERRTSVDDTLLGALEFPNGILAQFHCSIENQGRRNADIIGTTGSIHIPSPWFPGEEQAQFIVNHDGKQEAITTPGANNYQLEVEDFVDVYKNHQPLRWPPKDALANMAVIDALYASAREGKAVSVEG